jgi:XTP/dITP diphosphohydrolase
LQPRGNDGFGYDPIFVADGHTKSFSELSLAEKNSLSHRKKALDAWLDFLDLYL